jgi:hypothetical protein
MSSPVTYTPPTQNAVKEFDIKKGIFLALLAGGALWLGKRAWDKHQQSAEENRSAADVNTQQALILADAVKWSGDKKVIMNLAKQGFDFKAVSESYAKLKSGSSLIKDIESKLSNTEYIEFLNIIKSKEKAQKTTTATTAQKTELPSKNAYTDTCYKNKGLLVVNDTQTWNFEKVIPIVGTYKSLKKFKSGNVIQGVATGMVWTGSKGYELLVCATILKGKTYFFLVNKGDIKPITTNELQPYLRKTGVKNYVKWDDEKLFEKGWKA